MDNVGINAFSISLGVDLDSEPHLERTIEQCYRHCTEIVSKARLAENRKNKTARSASNNNNAVYNELLTSMTPSLSVTPPPDHQPQKQVDQFKRSPAAASNNNSPQKEDQQQQQQPSELPSAGYYASRTGNNNIQVNPSSVLPNKRQRPASPPPQTRASTATVNPTSSPTAVASTPPVSRRLSPPRPKPTISPSPHDNDDDDDAVVVQQQQQQQPHNNTHKYLQEAQRLQKQLRNSSAFGYNDEVLSYARFIGIDPEAEPWLLPIAKEGLNSELPYGWRETKSREDGATYYFNFLDKSTQWEHPLDEEYRRQVADARAVEKKKRDQNDSNAAGVGLFFQQNRSRSPTLENQQGRRSSSARFVSGDDIIPPTPTGSSIHHPHQQQQQTSRRYSSQQQQPQTDANDDTNLSSRDNLFSSSLSSSTAPPPSNQQHRKIQQQNQNQNSSNPRNYPHKGVEDRVENFAESCLGIDPIHEQYLLHIAREALLAPLPPNWKSFHDNEGTVYYFNEEEDRTQWDHPDLPRYLTKVKVERRQHSASGNISPTPAGHSRSPTTRNNINNNNNYNNGYEQKRQASSSSLPHHINDDEEQQQEEFSIHSEEVRQYAKFLGVQDPDREQYLMHTVLEGFNAPLPNGWSSYRSEQDGTVYYAHVKSGKTSYDHPLDEFYRHRIESERMKMMSR